MPDTLVVHVRARRAGLLVREGAQRYRFAYDPGYAGPPVFLNLPVADRERVWHEFPPSFENLLPEGVLLEQFLRTHKLDRTDRWGQLVAAGADLVGFLQIRQDELPAPPERSTPSGAKKRRAIQPGPLPYTLGEIVTYHSRQKPQMSISGVQPKAGAIFDRRSGTFRIVDQGGAYILKPSPQAYPEAAPNEALSMDLAAALGLDVPRHGLVMTTDQQPVYWVERFDRPADDPAYHRRVEDLCQLNELPSSFKYQGSLENVADWVHQHTSNPKAALLRLFERVLFSWVIGNEDMHLKNWSLMADGPLVQLAPVYDALNTVTLLQTKQESALTLRDRHEGWSRADLIEGFGREDCELSDATLARIVGRFLGFDWRTPIEGSQLSSAAKAAYRATVEDRLARLDNFRFKRSQVAGVDGGRERAPWQ